MTILGASSFGLMAAVGILTTILFFINRAIPSENTSDISKVLSLVGFVWSGSMIGAWISYGVRKYTFKFEQLLIPAEDDLMDPIIRLIFVGISAVILAGLIVSELITLKVGTYSIADQLVSPLNQFLSGFLFGLLESKLPGKFSSQLDIVDSNQQSINT